MTNSPSGSRKTRAHGTATHTPAAGTTNVPAAGGPVSGPPTTISPEQLPGSVELPPEDRVRRELAFFVLWIVVGVIAAGLALIALTPVFHLNADSVDSAIQLFFTATITLASTVFGFYFATRNR